MSGFFVEFKKDYFNEEYLKTLNLNYRQIKAVLHLKENRKITNSEYQLINNTSPRTATRDLETLVNIGIIKGKGQRKAAFYELVNGASGV